MNEIKSLKAPPEPIRDVLEGVLALLGIEDSSWLSMKAVLSRSGIISEMTDRLAVRTYRRLIDPNFGSIMDLV